MIGPRSAREQIADLLVSDRVLHTQAMGYDFALVEADAVLEWMKQSGYEQREIEYGCAIFGNPDNVMAIGPDQLEELRDAVRTEEGGIVVQRTKAGPWVPVEERGN